mmetsp:Transcript_24226/g.45972  ORF Transcript_24226/g.45972 Transcript_24226/m.45972 type:complete len:199 (-) Transcript_24226:95-691(-)
MFGLISGLLRWLMQKEERRMIILGIDNAGKTTMLEQLKGHFGAKAMPSDRIPPTIGFNIGRIQIDKVVAVFWDLGGHASFRSVWHNYYPEVQGIIFVVDSSDPPRMDEAKRTLIDVVSHEKLEGVPVLCMANKQDLPTALSVEEISSRFDFEHILGERPFHIHPCSAIKGEGLEPGVRWLLCEAGKVGPRCDPSFDHY